MITAMFIGAVAVALLLASALDDRRKRNTSHDARKGQQ